MVDETESTDDGLDAVVAAFEAATGGAVTPSASPVAPPVEVAAKPEAAPAPMESKPSLFGDLQSRYAQKPVDPRDTEVAGLRNQVASLDGATRQVILDRARERADADKREVVSKAEQIVAASGRVVPEGHAEMWLRHELGLDPYLAEAWSARWDGPEQAARCERAVQRALQKFEKSLAKLPSPEDIVLNYDRDAVTAVVRGATHAPAPPPAKPNFA